jgi:anti-anti-sigma factor
VETGQFAVTYDETAQALTVTGELDEETSATLREAVATHTDEFTHPISIDLSGVHYLPSAAVGVLAHAVQQSVGAGQPVELVAAQGTIAQRVLQVCALPHRTS